MSFAGAIGEDYSNSSSEDADSVCCNAGTRHEICHVPAASRFLTFKRCISCAGDSVLGTTQSPADFDDNLQGKETTAWVCYVDVHSSFALAPSSQGLSRRVRR